MPYIVTYRSDVVLIHLQACEGCKRRREAMKNAFKDAGLGGDFGKDFGKNDAKLKAAARQQTEANAQTQ